MKKCPKCLREYDDSWKICLHDNSTLDSHAPDKVTMKATSEEEDFLYPYGVFTLLFMILWHVFSSAHLPPFVPYLLMAGGGVVVLCVFSAAFRWIVGFLAAGAVCAGLVFLIASLPPFLGLTILFALIFAILWVC
jgi:hypothetical protein